jgi:hypothetical protein
MLQEARISIKPSYWMCMVSNYDFHIESEFILYNPTNFNAKVKLAFPFSTHNILGDHNEAEDFDINTNNQTISYRVALNRDLYSFKSSPEAGRELYYKDSNMNVNPEFLKNHRDLYKVSPSLYNDGFEMFAYWDMEFESHEKRIISIKFAHFSGFSCESNCPYSYDHFQYNISYAKYWDNPVKCSVMIHKDFETGIETSLEKIDYEYYILLQGTNTSQPIEVKIEKPPCTLEGYIYDTETNAPINNVKVEIEDSSIFAATNESGYFKLENITSIGTYKIIISKNGYEPIREEVNIYYNNKIIQFNLEKSNELS